jgi:hypothetical protein
MRWAFTMAYRSGCFLLRAGSSLRLSPGAYPVAISNMQAMVAIQMRIGMARPFLMPLVPSGRAAPTIKIIRETNRSILRRLRRTPHFV